MSAQLVSAREINVGEIPRARTAERAVLNLKAGDEVVVRSPDEIAETLDEDGTLDSLPFMPEMLECCGKRFRVLNRVVQSTIDGAFLGGHSESYVREFRNNDVVTLQNVRCSGAQHDTCQRACAIFWKEAWLRKVDDQSEVVLPRGSWLSIPEDLSSRLKTMAQPGRYFCQSSEFLKATLHLSMVKRIKKCFSAISVGNISVWGMTRNLIAWVWWRAHYKFVGESVRGTLDKTPTDVLDLKPGDLVQIKSLPEIKSTLNKRGRNRGLHFSADQRPFCGQQFRVRNRADNFIAEGTGEMKHFRNTVMLEDVLCDSACFAFGGCYRSDLLYWREIWLRKI
jgi:hypothetical protein